MKIGLRKPKAAIGIAAGLLTAAVTMTTAAATPAVAAPAPTTSPAAEERVFIPFGSTEECRPGRACAVVPVSNGGYVFKFFRYGRYRLSYFLGSGSVFNNQTGGAAMRLDGVNGNQLRCIPAGRRDTVNWDPVWYIRLTASPC